MRRAISLAFVVVALSWTPTLADDGSLPISGEVRLGVGYSSNPLRLPEGEASGAYVPFDLRLDWEPIDRSDRRFRLRFDLDGRRFNSSGTEGANRGRARVEARHDWRFRPHGGAKHDLVVRAGARRDDRVWVSRASGEDFELTSEQLGRINVADRYDADTYSAELIYKRRSGPTRWEIELEAARRDYLEDYEDVPDIDSLDHERYFVKARYRHRFLGKVLELWGGAQLLWRDYDARWPRTQLGQDVLDATQEFRDTALRAEVRWRPWARVDRSERLELALEYRYGWRDDLFEGFYDRDTRDWNFSLDTRLRRDVFLALDVSTGTTDYVRYRVGNVSTNPFFSLDDLEIEATLALATRWSVTLELEAGWIDADSNNALYRYEDWSGGVALVWEF